LAICWSNRFGEILIWWNHSKATRLTTRKIYWRDLNLAIAWRFANSPNLVPRQYLFLYGICKPRKDTVSLAYLNRARLKYYQLPITCYWTLLISYFTVQQNTVAEESYSLAWPDRFSGAGRYIDWSIIALRQKSCLATRNYWRTLGGQNNSVWSSYTCIIQLTTAV